MTAQGIAAEPTPHTGLEVVKSAAPRTVLRGGGRVVKVYRDVSLADRLRRRLFGRSPARREARNLRRALEAGLPVPRILEPVAGRVGGEERLVLEEIANARSLEDLVRDGVRSPSRRRALAIALADLVRRVHTAGLDHADLHAGNVLVDGDDRLWLVDLHRARWRRLGEGARRRSLLSLGRHFLVHASRVDRLRFLRAYEPMGWREAARGLERDLRRSCERFWRRRLARRYRRSRHVRALRIGAFRGLALTAFEGADGIPVRPVAGERVVKSGRTSTVAIAAIRDRTIVVKRYHRKKPFAPLLDLFRGGRARRAFRLGHALRMRGLATPEPLAWLERRGPFGLPGESVLVTAFEEGPTARDALLEASLDGRRARLEAIGRAVRGLLEAGFVHRDLKLDNWLWSAAADAPVLLDLDGAHQGRIDDVRLGAHLARLDRDLADAGFSRTERLRVVRAVLTPCGRKRLRAVLDGLAGRASRGGRR